MNKDEASAHLGEEVREDLDRPRGSLRGPLILAKFVVDALEKKQQGDDGDYQAAVEQLSTSQMKQVTMQRWLQALKLCVSHLTEDYDLLVGATLRFTWYNKDPGVVKLYIDYLTHLISAQTYYLKSVLQTLVKALWIPTADDGERVHRNIHEAVQSILRIVPTAPSVLMLLLSKNYPFKGKKADIQELAMRNALHIATYCPTLGDDILQLVVHQMLNIDVEVPRLEEGEEEEEEEDEEEEEEGGEGEQEGTQFHVELDGCLANGTASNGGCHDNNCLSLTASYSQQPVMANEAAEKLDMMMMVMFDHLHSICHTEGAFMLESAAKLLRSLLKIFEEVILPTHACSHVQFLLFNLTSLNKAFPGYFLDFLWEKFKNPNTPSVIRQATAAYMASYIARAKFVPLITAKLCLTVMVQWLHKYIDECSPEHIKPDVRQHGHFYSLCQASFYVFIFRHKGLLEMEGGRNFLRQMNLERIVSSRLNPLKVCLPTVVEMFASLTSRHEVVFCYTILEQNKRLILATPVSQLPTHKGAVAAVHTSHANLLDSFFPFDPYYLKRSAKYVQPNYQEWEGPEGEEKTGEECRMEEDDQSPVSSSSFMSAHYPPAVSGMDLSLSPSLSQNSSFSPH